MKKKFLGLFFLLCVLLTPLLVRFAPRDTAKSVETQTVAKHEIKASVLASGNLVYKSEARLSPEIIGKVTEILVKEGDRVTAGQVVLRLDQKEYYADVAQQEAAVRQQQLTIRQKEINVRSQQLQFSRQDSLLKSKYISEVQFDEVRYAVEAARVDLQASRESLLQAQALLQRSQERASKANIRAPISGTVIAIDIKVGETAVASQVGIAGSSLMTIADTDTIGAEVSVDEADIARVKAGQEVAIYTAAYADTAIKGRVQAIPLVPKRVDTQAGSLARNYTIKVSVENSGLLLRPGMTCRAEIFSNTVGHAVAVPIQAILSNNDETTEVNGKGKKSDAIETYVFVNRAGVAEKRVVKTGISDDSYQEILSGLKPGDEIITGPYKLLRYLNAGDSIKATPAGAQVGDGGNT